MSITTKIDIFTLKVREKGNKNYLNLNDVSGFNLINEISLYLGKNIYLFKIDKEAERTSRIDKNELLDDILFSRIKIGKFGEASEIVDTLSGSGIFHKEREHSDTIPLFFSIKLNKDNTSATIYIERRNNKNILPELKNILSNVIENIRENLFIYEIKPLKEVISINDFINKNYGYINRVSLSLDNKISGDYFEPIVLSFKTRSKKETPESLIQIINEITNSGNLELFKELLPKELKKLNIISVMLELRFSNKTKAVVNINESIKLSNSLSIDLNKESLDKLGHPAYKFLKDYTLNLK